MTPPAARLLRRLADSVVREGAATLVTVADTKGSAPREAGAMMAVLADGSYFGTIGGGALEHEAQVLARQLAARGEAVTRRIDRALGPDLGQCCGGRVILDLRVFARADADELQGLAGEAATRDSRQPLLVFGAGHVGRAISLALAPLPFRISWIDGRDDAFPAHVAANADVIASRDPPAEIARAEPGSFVLVLTHDHALDLAITAAALGRPDLPFVGLIGSATKRARFERRLRELGLDETRIASLVCPIGLPGIHGKEPAVIAASVAAQLLGLVGENAGPAKQANSFLILQRAQDEDRW
ncbi:MAG: xanthine dehydrogenase accessory protein XdhC [Hyphomicrobiales bacterium]|nr:xanthine dehydrogenase accessory protein XdhC [Hyphomicrobiales bacterium]